MSTIIWFWLATSNKRFSDAVQDENAKMSVILGENKTKVSQIFDVILLVTEEDVIPNYSNGKNKQKSP